MTLCGSCFLPPDTSWWHKCWFSNVTDERRSHHVLQPSPLMHRPLCPSPYWRWKDQFLLNKVYQLPKPDTVKAPCACLEKKGCWVEPRPVSDQYASIESRLSIHLSSQWSQDQTDVQFSVACPWLLSASLSLHNSFSWFVYRAPDCRTMQRPLQR